MPQDLNYNTETRPSQAKNNGHDGHVFNEDQGLFLRQASCQLSSTVPATGHAMISRPSSGGLGAGHRSVQPNLRLRFAAQLHGARSSPSLLLPPGQLESFGEPKPEVMQCSKAQPETLLSSAPVEARVQRWECRWP